MADHDQPTDTDVKLAMAVADRAGAALEGDAVVVPRDYAVVDTERYLYKPKRHRGIATMTDQASFIAYVDRHRTEAMHLFANADKATVTAVLNHDDKNPGWGDWGARLELAFCDPWSEWKAKAGEKMNQAQFAEFIDEHIPDIAHPAGADLLDMIKTLRIKQNVDFSSGFALTNGQVQFRYQETLDGKGAAKGNVNIPELFTLGLPIYEGQEPYRIEAKLRWRLREGKLALFYVIQGISAHEKGALNDVTSAIAKELNLKHPIYNGSAA